MFLFLLQSRAAFFSLFHVTLMQSMCNLCAYLFNIFFVLNAKEQWKKKSTASINSFDIYLTRTRLRQLFNPANKWKRCGRLKKFSGSKKKTRTTAHTLERKFFISFFFRFTAEWHRVYRITCTWIICVILPHLCHYWPVANQMERLPLNQWETSRLNSVQLSDLGAKQPHLDH